jgi:septation ring formation regulator EzrA
MPPYTDETSMSEWRVNLQGDELELEELAALLTSPDRRIRREEGRYFLVADRLNNIEDAQNVRETAEAMLQSLNGLARLRINARKPQRNVSTTLRHLPWECSVQPHLSDS